MFEWAKKLTAHFPTRDTEQDPLTEADTDPERETKQDARQTPEKEAEVLSPEKGVSTDKKPPSFAKKFTRFRGLSRERKSPSKISRSKSGSPEPEPTLVRDRGSSEKNGKSGILASGREQSSHSRAKWGNRQLGTERTKESSSSPERFSTPDRQDVSDRQSTPERYYTPDSCPTPDKTSDPELSGAGKQSISEKLYGEVIKGFDKIRNTKTKIFARDGRDVNGRDDAEVRKTGAKREFLRRSSGESENSVNGARQCHKTNITVNNKVNQSTSGEVDTREHKLSDNELRPPQKDKKAVDTKNTQRYMPEEPLVTLCPDSPKEVEKTRKDSKHPELDELFESLLSASTKPNQPKGDIKKQPVKPAQTVPLSTGMDQSRIGSRSVASPSLFSNWSYSPDKVEADHKQGAPLTQEATLDTTIHTEQLKQYDSAAEELLSLTRLSHLAKNSSQSGTDSSIGIGKPKLFPVKVHPGFKEGSCQPCFHDSSYVKDQLPTIAVGNPPTATSQPVSFPSSNPPEVTIHQPSLPLSDPHEVTTHSPPIPGSDLSKVVVGLQSPSINVSDSQKAAIQLPPPPVSNPSEVTAQPPPLSFNNVSKDGCPLPPLRPSNSQEIIAQPLSNSPKATIQSGPSLTNPPKAIVQPQPSLVCKPPKDTAQPSYLTSGSPQKDAAHLAPIPLKNPSDVVVQPPPLVLINPSEVLLQPPPLFLSNPLDVIVQSPPLVMINAPDVTMQPPLLPLSSPQEVVVQAPPLLRSDSYKITAQPATIPLNGLSHITNEMSPTSDNLVMHNSIPVVQPPLGNICISINTQQNISEDKRINPRSDVVMPTMGEAPPSAVSSEQTNVEGEATPPVLCHPSEEIKGITSGDAVVPTVEEVPPSNVSIEQTQTNVEGEAAPPVVCHPLEETKTSRVEVAMPIMEEALPSTVLIEQTQTNVEGEAVPPVVCHPLTKGSRVEVVMPIMEGLAFMPKSHISFPMMEEALPSTVLIEQIQTNVEREATPPVVCHPLEETRSSSRVDAVRPIMEEAFPSTLLSEQNNVEGKAAPPFLCHSLEETKSFSSGDAVMPTVGEAPPSVVSNVQSNIEEEAAHPVLGHALEEIQIPGPADTMAKAVKKKKKKKRRSKCDKIIPTMGEAPSHPVPMEQRIVEKESVLPVLSYPSEEIKSCSIKDEVISTSEGESSPSVSIEQTSSERESALPVLYHPSEDLEKDQIPSLSASTDIKGVTVDNSSNETELTDVLGSSMSKVGVQNSLTPPLASDMPLDNQLSAMDKKGLSSPENSTDKPENLSFTESFRNDDEHTIHILNKGKQEVVAPSSNEVSQSRDQHTFSTQHSGGNTAELKDADSTLMSLKSDPVKIDSTVSTENKSDDKAALKEDTLTLLNKSFDNIIINHNKLKESQNSLKSVTKQTDGRIFTPLSSLPNSLNSSFDGTTVDGSLMPPIAPRRLSRESGGGSTRDIRSRFTSTTMTSNLHPTSTTKDTDSHNTLSARMTRSQSSFVTRLDEFDKKANAMADARESYRPPAASEGGVGGSLPASPLVPHRKKKRHVLPATRSLHILSAASGSAKTTTEGAYEGKAFESISCKAPPLPPKLSLSYNSLSLPRASSRELHKPVTMEKSENASLPSKQTPPELNEKSENASLPSKQTHPELNEKSENASLPSKQTPPELNEKSQNTSLPSKETPELNNKSQNVSLPSKETPTEPTKLVSTATTSKPPSAIPTILVPGVPAESSLNPFDSEDEEDTEPVTATSVVEAPSHKPVKKVSLNPFDSDDDDDDDEVKDEPIIQTTNTKRQVPPAGYNPFDDDDDEEEEDAKRKLSCDTVSTKTAGRKEDQSAIPFRSHYANTAKVTASLNPFDEDEDEEESTDYTAPSLSRESAGRQSRALRSSSPFQRDVSRASLPNSERLLINKKKRQAPLPPGYTPSDASSVSGTPPLPRRQATLPWGTSSNFLRYETSWRKDSSTSASTLSLSSPKRPPPARPPLPKHKSTSMAQL